MDNVREVRRGEQVRLRLEQEDENGAVMWDLTSTWYGFDNATANTFAVGLLKAVGEYTQAMSAKKNG